MTELLEHRVRSAGVLALCVLGCALYFIALLYLGSLSAFERVPQSFGVFLFWGVPIIGSGLAYYVISHHSSRPMSRSWFVVIASALLGPWVAGTLAYLIWFLFLGGRM